MNKVLVNLPDKLCLHNDTCQAVNDLWKYFLAIYEKITSGIINESGENIWTNTNIHVIFSICKQKREKCNSLHALSF